jgi:hypothetical protein
MPRVVWDQATYDLWYNGWVDGALVTYGRAHQYAEADGFTPEQSGVARRRDFLIANAMPGLTATDRILVGGCGLGYLMARFRAAGYPNCWGIENSPHIESIKNVEAEDATIWVVDDFTGGGRVRNKLRTLTGDDEFDWVITEGLLESFDDAELPPYFSAAESVLAPGRPLAAIIHYVWVPPFADDVAGALNEKSIDAWKAMQPAHTWVSDTGEVR